MDRHNVEVTDYLSVMKGFGLVRNGDRHIQFQYERVRLSCNPCNVIVRSYETERRPRQHGGSLQNLHGLRVGVQGTLLKGFKLNHDEQDQAFFSFTTMCARDGFPHLTIGNAIEVNTVYNDAGILRSDPHRHGSLIYLDRHRAEAPAGYAIESFCINLRARGEVSSNQIAAGESSTAFLMNISTDVIRLR